MKWIFLLLITTVITMLGCTPTEKPVTSDDVLNNPEKYASEEEDMNLKPGEWLTDWDQALSMAKKLNHPILVDFTGSDWCIWCQKLEGEVFSKDKFKDYAKSNLILLKLDFPRSIPQTDEVKKANQEKMKEFNVEGYPTVVLLNTEGKEIARTGYVPGGAEKYVLHLQDLLKQATIK
ncbi:MAG: thioredoxin family protein [Candidatus Cloacimonas sp.]